MADEQPGAALASARAALAAVPSLRLAVAVAILFFVLEMLHRWAVLRPVRRRSCARLRRLEALTAPRQAERSAAAQRELGRDARELRRRAAELSAPATFVESAKLARQAAAKEKEVEHLRAGAAARRRRAPALAKAAIQSGCVAALWGLPMLSAPGPPLGWPLDGWLAAQPRPGALLPPGAVGALPYALLCGRVASLLARALLPT